jgi:hypothetical protein
VTIETPDAEGGQSRLGPRRRGRRRVPDGPHAALAGEPVTGGSRPTLRMSAEAAAHRFRESVFLLPALIMVGGMGLADTADRAAHEQAISVTW